MKMLAAKLDYLNLIPDPHGGRRVPAPVRCPLTSTLTHTTYVYPYTDPHHYIPIYMHIHKINKGIFKTKKRRPTWGSLQARGGRTPTPFLTALQQQAVAGVPEVQLGRLTYLESLGGGYSQECG